MSYKTCLLIGIFYKINFADKTSYRICLLTSICYSTYLLEGFWSNYETLKRISLKFCTPFSLWDKPIYCYAVVYLVEASRILAFIILIVSWNVQQFLTQTAKKYASISYFSIRITNFVLYCLFQCNSLAYIAIYIWWWNILIRLCFLGLN